MKHIILTLLLIVGLSLAQTYDDTIMNIDVSVPAPQEVIDQIATIRTYIEIEANQMNIDLYQGMPLAEAEALGGTLVQSGTYGTGINYQLPADGSYYQVGVFGLDASGNELIHMIAFDRYFVRCGVSGIGQLPTSQLVTDHDVYIQVNVTFQ